MEEEIHYSTLVFNKNASPSKEEKEDVTVYSGVKFAEPVTTEPKENKDPTTTSEFKAKEPEATVSSKFAEIEPVADSHSRTHLLPMCLGILCIILLASMIGLIVYIITVMNKLEANLSDLKGQNEQLIVEKKVLENQTEQVTVKMKMFENQTEQLKMEKRRLENQTEQLSRDRDDLNWTLGVILTFNSFPVNEFCPNKKCQSCRTGWIQYQKKCYLFYEDSQTWMTWSDSRQYCQDKNADLVVIDDLQEQKFISQNTKYYYDKFHGYWMGLQNNGTTWVWIDGHKDTLQYWRTLNEKLYGLTIPGTNISQSWDSGNIEFQNKFICEDDVLIRSN
ncbi:C-type lectin domain family 12 member B-like isoform X1 [Melanotaenia boesemani]|uniref:C-type lectin domain family 12 member B-like isoform X1 n=1 Tax=Melanotaenia boesemani TaxID=1250792 RepID=UPI001C052DEA|nr:C-type lectin domain family 12 member B-like isoform X1 [Melanotaenia boesemani]